MESTYTVAWSKICAQYVILAVFIIVITIITVSWVNCLPIVCKGKTETLLPEAKDTYLCVKGFCFPSFISETG